MIFFVSESIKYIYGDAPKPAKKNLSKKMHSARCRCALLVSRSVKVFSIMENNIFKNGGPLNGFGPLVVQIEILITLDRKS